MQSVLWLPIVSSELTSRKFKAVCRRCAQSLLVLAILYAPFALSASGDPTRFRAGLRNSGGSRSLGAKQLRAALERLRQETGFLEMRFDELGFLTLGSPVPLM